MTAGDMLAVVRIMRRGPTTMRKIAAAGKFDERIAKDAVHALLVFGLLEERRIPGGMYRLMLADGTGDDDVRAAHVQWLEAKRTRHLPVMQPGDDGDRRDDCANYDECLTAFARAYSDAVDAYCPEVCERFAPFADGWRRMGHDSAARKEWA